jgi:hypothetical protein
MLQKRKLDIFVEPRKKRVGESAGGRVPPKKRLPKMKPPKE